MTARIEADPHRETTGDAGAGVLHRWGWPHAVERAVSPWTSAHSGEQARFGAPPGSRAMGSVVRDTGLGECAFCVLGKGT